MMIGWQGFKPMRRWLPAVLAGLLAVGCTDLSDDTQLAEQDVRYALPTQEFQSVEMVHTDDGKEVFLLRAPHLDRYGNQDRAELYGGIDIDFFKNGKPSSHLTADSGVVLKNGNELRGIGHVVVTTDTGTTILTPRMTWTRKDGLIKSDTIVTIITEFDTLHGTGLVATDDLKKRRILHPTGVSTRSMARGDAAQPGAPQGKAVPVDTTKADSLHEDTVMAEVDSIIADLPPDTSRIDTVSSDTVKVETTSTGTAKGGGK